ncbi:uncharacterized protein LOC111360825 [Spodoptera litura]|uniref:Uncharacterized protein LOC111360825 n=1 Tax=Spodoptera litura TaxID=69820 RepID=A0A9J7ELX0_SPOLT|nr:uncharacterized protein LOC111360825 [Spodoptera litura]
MEGKINILKDLQTVIQKALTNFKKSPKERLSVEYIQTRLELLENDWSSFKNTKTQLYGQYKIEDIVSQKVADIYDSTEDIYITCKCLMKSTLNKININEPQMQNNSCNNSTNSSKSSHSFVKLPKITIPTFSGKYSEWTTFHDLFISLVHNNKSLDNVQKLHYLKSHLTGEAEQLIRHTPITDANYSECWSHLEKRYANKKYLTNCILKRLFGQKRLIVESATSLKELLDTTSDCLSALKNLNIDVSTWDVIIIHIVTFKLDNETRKQWELSISNDSNSSNELPTFDQFKTFIEGRFRALECIEPRKVMAHQVNHSSHIHNSKAMLATKSSNIRCEYCSEPHKLCFCKQFAKQSTDGRREFVAKNKICFNCLGGNHTVYDCKKQTFCRVCKKRHHSLLHPNREPPADSDGHDVTAKSTVDNTSASTSDQIVACLSTRQTPKPKQVLLATALIKAENRLGDFQTIRALLDQGSQACFITEAATQFLRLKKIPVRGIVSGLGHERPTISKYMVNLTIKSTVDHAFQLNLNAYVLNKITSYLPERSVSTSSIDWINLNNLCLADPYFGTPNKIDVLLGADAYCCIMKEGIVKSPSCNLMAQNTTLGWVLSGVVSTSNESSNLPTNNISVHCAQFNEDHLLKKFWELEEQTSTKKIFSPEEQKCEELYTKTTKRDDTGRYIVHLPFRDDDPACKAAGSRDIAEIRFKSLEKRLDKNIDLKQKYTEVINEYLHLGHLRAVKKEDDKRYEAVYLPHHAIIREDKTTTKVRVVFNASEKNKKGVSLNDTLMVGPTLQADLRHTILRWRVHAIGIVADIIKMYRQVRVTDEDTVYQRILWRDDPKQPIGDYELVTVTFGTASAPYQAVRTLHQVAYDEGDKYPLAAAKVLNSFYMDDLMTGSNSIEEGVEICKQMIELLGKGGFALQKWNSNNQQLLDRLSSICRIEEVQQLDQTQLKEENKDKVKQDIIGNDRKIVEKDIEIKLDSTIKILGLTWNRREDCFQYSVNLPPLTTAPVTKRSIVSDIARLFDPLGWLAPSVVVAKMFIQKLWLAGVSWDEELTTNLKTEWSTYRGELILLTKIQVPRWLSISSNNDLELHGFSDASKAAYSAVVYLRTIDTNGNVKVSLLVAKTRVAPIKQISIPRLELCGAVLLSKVLVESAEVLNIPETKIFAWTDSTVVLSWLSSHPSRWITFVANRTSEILSNMSSTQWFHVSTKHNPADCASRGLLPSSLVYNELWFIGPCFLKNKVMSTQAFLAAFRRFVSRRGHCAKLWSDNGTNFIGASRELQELASIQPAIAEYLEANNTEWHFIPPHAPNFGGLWEAGVKSTKFHLKRVIGDSTLTYEELTTFLNQVEACLNSRPISVINFTDPGEPLPLTPGHFLIGEPLINVPDRNYESSNVNCLTRWQFVQRMLQSFWKRWSHEYLSNLMNRYKWASKVPEPNIGDVVLIKEDDLPPSRWLLGRVVEKHPGADNVTRVVTLRTKSSVIKRPTSKICILPISDQ